MKKTRMYEILWNAIEAYEGRLRDSFNFDSDDEVRDVIIHDFKLDEEEYWKISNEDMKSRFKHRALDLLAGQ